MTISDGTFLPGWYPDQRIADALRWWDGERWAAQPGADPRVQVGVPTPDGRLCTWTAPYGWPQVPQRWFPPALWRPTPRLPYEVGFRWWRLESLPGVYDYGMDARYDDLLHSTLNLERSFPDTPAYFASIAEKVWVAPPNWPAAPSDWEPPAGWHPDLSWGPAPEGWEFYQPDPRWLAEHLELRDRVFVLGSYGIETLLNRVEEYVAWSVAVVERLRQVSEFLVSTGAAERLTPDEESRLATAQDAVVRSASAARTYVLHAVFSVGAFDGWFRNVRAALNFAMRDLYEEASSAFTRLAGTGVSVVSGDIPAPDAARVEVHSLIMQASAILHIHAPLRGEGQDEDDEERGATTRGHAHWERAEELAAKELRERGFRDAQRTPPGADGGFDVEGRGVVAQVKYLGTPVGREAVQRLAGANTHGARMAFFSRAGYTRTALAFAEQADIALFLIKVEDESVVAANDLGERFWA
ncbi:hypothetical protein CBR64_17755 [Cellulosimicrobium cellulans]|uniref:Restriction endonuclease type IV Mrr domain-containing protein n=1 Tax=Cellulosimicrobium cellulans TaxID=1710 RepID=A0A1Y0I0T4_CELCE|nr:restriction endonuclease [Cellulosimicrobium cellulans]ARU53003.1 hypothetical protein CBR64_17755 [Cellulosimicrobium cellulans]